MSEVKIIDDKIKWNNFLLNQPTQTGIFLQSAEWLDFQEINSHKIYRLGLVDKENNLKTICGAIVNSLPLGKKYFYVPYGMENLYTNIKDFGSGYPSDPVTCKFLEEHGKEHRKDGIFRESWQTWKTACKKQEQKKQLQMTKQEVKEEFRDMEGDPQVKHRIRQRAREMAQMRMMEEVPQADVVITNPTHFAVALKYLGFAPGERPPAPQVVAKGQDLIALRIRALAAEHEVPVVEDPPLARALYAEVEIGELIPAEHFAAVVTILTHVQGARVRESMRARA